MADEQVIAAMTDALVHRGPDDSGLHLDVRAGVALGHRRLAIIDLSSAGRQPMSYDAGRYWITYNGEVYNYRELRRELEGQGHTFRTQTDTEVVLAAYAQWGEECLHRFRGMFAFAIYDSAAGDGSESAAGAGRVFLARDRFGIKPVYYSSRPGAFVFASELKAMLASGLVSRRVDRQAIWDYLSLGSVPQPRTILADVKCLLPGHAMYLDLHGAVVCEFEYWDIADAASALAADGRVPDRQAATAELQRQLDEATRFHMVADVPVGAFLSGGIDSSAMVGLMSRHVSRPIKTFTVGFENASPQADELKWAALAAERFGTEHTEVIITDNAIADCYDDIVRSIDQPSLDGANTYLVSRAASTSVKVALSGLGGDELFAGYSHFRRHLVAARLRRNHRAWAPLWRASRCLPDRFRHNLMLPALTPLERHATVRCHAYERDKAALTSTQFRSGIDLRPLTDFYTRHWRDELDTVTQLSYTELNGYMAHTLLRDVDAMSMAHSLEVRPILLDHVLATFAFMLPAAYKLGPDGSKSILTDALRDLLPTEILERGKRGFELPLLRWLAGPLRDRALGALASASAAAIFAPAFLRRARGQVAAPGRRDTRLWPYVILLEWLESNRCTL